MVVERKIKVFAQTTTYIDIVNHWSKRHCFATTTTTTTTRKTKR